MQDPTRLHPEPSKRTLGAAVGSTSPTTHVVRPGESFWSIAEQHVAAHRGNVHEVGSGVDPEQHVAKYWERLVSANRNRLRVAGQIDLLYPGDTIELPGL